MIAIDLGSNTLRAVTRDCKKKSFGKSFECMVKTAEGLTHSGLISSEAIDRIIKALREMQKELDFDSHEIVAKTTAAMRLAGNSKEAIGKIFEETGVLFELIDAKQEAYYTQLAVASRLKELGLSQEFVLLDVGGGSTEIIVCRDDVQSISIDVGIVTMSERFTHKDALIESLYSVLKPIRGFMETLPHRPSLLVSTAGTPTTMAAMKQGLNVANYDPDIINGTMLNEDELARQLQRLLAMEEEERARHVGVGRDVLIVTGVEILRVLMNILGFDSMMVIDDGLREGLAIESCLLKNKTIL